MSRLSEDMEVVAVSFDKDIETMGCIDPEGMPQPIIREWIPEVAHLEDMLKRAVLFIESVVEGGEWEGCAGREIVIDAKTIIDEV